MVDSYKEARTPIDLARPEVAPEKPKMTRDQARASISADLKSVSRDLDNQRMVLLAELLHTIVSCKVKPIDENGIGMILESSKAVLENGDKNLISALVGVQRTVLGMFFDIKSKMGSDEEKAKK